MSFEEDDQFRGVGTEKIMLELCQKTYKNMFFHYLINGPSLYPN